MESIALVQWQIELFVKLGKVIASNNTLTKKEKLFINKAVFDAFKKKGKK